MSYRNILWDEAGEPPPFQPELSILGSVVSRPTADRAVIDVGWKSASNNSGPPVPKRTELTLSLLVMSMGIIKHRDGQPISLALGEKIVLIPSHCDTTVNRFSEYLIIRDCRLDLGPRPQPITIPIRVRCGIPRTSRQSGLLLLKSI